MWIPRPHPDEAAPLAPGVVRGPAFSVDGFDAGVLGIGLFDESNAFATE